MLKAILKKPTFIWFLIGSIFAAALMSINSIKIESAPEIDQAVSIVRTIYPNTSSFDVESNVTDPLEEKLKNVADLKSLSSESLDGISIITVNFEDFVNSKEAKDRTQEIINQSLNILPDTAFTPEVIEFDFNNQPVMDLNILADFDLQTLSQKALEIKEKIETISGVKEAVISGDLSMEAQINLDNQKLIDNQIDYNQVISNFRSFNQNYPLGTVYKGKNKNNLRLSLKPLNFNEYAFLPILKAGSYDFVQLKDIAEIKLKTLEPDTQSFVSKFGNKLKKSVSLTIYKKKGENLVNVSNAIDAMVKEINKNNPQLEFVKSNDNAYFIKKDLKTLVSSGFQTVLIIFIAILLVLSLSEALVALISIPLIFLITVLLLNFSGQTISGLTIFSLILSLGLIVDNSIVIIEGVSDFRQKGYSNLEASLKAFEAYHKPLIAGTLTTVAAFFPMLLVSGVVGAFISTIPKVLTITLLASLLVSFLITPVIASSIIKKAHQIKPGLKKIITSYKAFLSNIIYSKKTSKKVVRFAILAFFISLVFPITGALQAQLFPKTDVPFTYVNFEGPDNSNLNDTLKVVNKFNEAVQNIDGIESLKVLVGSNFSAQLNPAGSEIKDNLAYIAFNLSSEKRPKSYEISEKLREFENIEPSYKISVVETSAGPPTLPPIEIKIYGIEFEIIKEYALKVQEFLEQTKGIINVENSFDTNKTNFVLESSLSKLSFYNLNPQSISSVLNLKTDGVKLDELNINDKKIDLRLYLDKEQDLKSSQLNGVQIPSQNGTLSLNSIGEIKEVKTLDSISRIDQKRSIKIQADIEKDASLSDINTKIQNFIENVELKPGYLIETGGEDEEIKESFMDLFRSMGIAIILIFAILIFQFNSFKQTIIVLFSLPLASIGIFPGLSLIGAKLSFPAFLGIVMLTGIVVNDAIVMIDLINQNREKMDLDDAIVVSASERFIPIILTSITTILGILPITIQDEFWRGLGTAVIFGLFTATMLTLIVIPAMFNLWVKDEK